MHVEFTSLFEPPRGSDRFPIAALLRHAALLEDADIDRVAIDQRSHEHGANAPFIVLENASQLGVLLQHRVGELSAELAAEQFGLFDQLSRGRLALQVQAPSTAAFAEKHDAHERIQESLDEFLTLIKRLWASEEPFDFEGEHHRVSAGHVASKPFGRRNIPLVLSGLSGTAIKVAAKHADLFVLQPAPIAELRQDIARVRNAAFSFGRADRIGFSVAVRPLIGSTRDQAWSLAGTQRSSEADQAPGQRLVGTAEQVALQLISLVDLGVTDFVVHGLQDEEQLALFAEHVVPLVRNSALRQSARGIRELLSGTGAFGIYATPER